MIKGLPLPTKLQKLDYPTITNDECNSRGHNVGPKEVCAASRAGQGRIFKVSRINMIIF